MNETILYRPACHELSLQIAPDQENPPVEFIGIRRGDGLPEPLFLIPPGRSERAVHAYRIRLEDSKGLFMLL